MEKVNLGNVTIVLHHPRFPENIGSAARAAANMGVSRLIVVSPEDFDREKILKLATHAVVPLVDAIEVREDLGATLAPFNYVIGTTARTGRYRQATLSPDSVSRKLQALLHNNSLAVVFGPEDRGLTNEELRLCQDVIAIPTAGFHSLNVAQAVMIVCWELFRTAARGNGRGETVDPSPAPELATRHDIEGMFGHLRDTLVRIEFLHHENPDHWMRTIRKMFNRFLLRKTDVNLFRGICKQINWYLDHRG